MDTDREDALTLARDRWVPTALAHKMIEAVAPPKETAAGDMAHRWLERERGRLACRPIPDGLSSRDRVRAAVRGRSLPPVEHEWNLADLILRLLEWRVAAGWTTPAELILRLATAEPSELPALALQRLATADLDAPQGSQGAPPAKGGAPCKYPWDQIGAAFGAWLHDGNGRARLPFPEHHDAVLELAAALGAEGTPDQETVRRYVKIWKAAYLATLGKPD
jgi:hypothetical protein